MKYMKVWSDNMKRNISVTIKPTHACNMRCKHCFNGEKLEEKEMLTVEDTCRFMELLAKEYKGIGLTFHGGEPTLAGIDYYRQVFRFEKELNEKYGATFMKNITTNGICLDEDFVDLLIENDVLINVSFDGPHNNTLRERTDLIYKKLCELREKKARFRVYCVETELSSPNLLETYEWFKENGFDFKMVPIQPYGNANGNSELIITPDTFVNNLMDLYKHWLTDMGCKITFYTFEEFLKLEPESAFKTPWLYRKLALNPNGKVYPFGRPNDVNYCLGDVRTLENINDCFEAEDYKVLMNILEKNINEFCKDCGSKDVCGGITVSSTFVYGSDYEVLKYGCVLADKIFRGALELNKQVAADIANGYGDKYPLRVRQQFDSDASSIFKIEN